MANRDSFEYVKKYYEEIVKASPEISLILIGNKSDSERKVSLLEGENFAENIGFILYVESSPENRDTIYDVIRLLALQLILKSLVVVDIEEIDNIKILVETKRCPYCMSKKYTTLEVNDEFFEVWECHDCGKHFEIKKAKKFNDKDKNKCT